MAKEFLLLSVKGLPVSCLVPNRLLLHYNRAPFSQLTRIRLRVLYVARVLFVAPCLGIPPCLLEDQIPTAACVCLLAL